MKYLSLLMLAVVAVGCNRSNDSMVTRYHEDGRAKPILAIAPMIDTTSFDMPWSLSDELTTSVTNQVAQNGRIYVVSQEELSFTDHNPFSSDLGWVKKTFEGEEFVAFLELVDHSFNPATKVDQGTSPYEVSTNLNMAVRLRVVDLRGQTCKVVLQEMVRHAYFIPKTLLPTNYNVAVWGTDEYRKSPMGVAHAQLVQEIETRISDYVLLAKSR